MVKSRKQDKFARPILGNEKETQENHRTTRGTSKVLGAKDRNQGTKEDDMPGASGRRKKNESTQKVSVNVKSKAKSLPPAVLGVVFGEVEMPVSNLQEMRKEEGTRCVKMWSGYENCR